MLTKEHLTPLQRTAWENIWLDAERKTPGIVEVERGVMLGLSLNH